jgi:pentose-5-phosphate-3-epimerase
MVELVPSILSADFSKLGLEVEAAERGGGSVIHIDIMDGHFLPMVHHVLVMSVNPGFGGQKFIPFSLDKIRQLAELREELGLNFRIEVDGGVAHDTIASVVEAGADLLVAGSAVFDSGHPEKEARMLLKMAQEAEQRRQGLTLSN